MTYKLKVQNNGVLAQPSQTWLAKSAKHFKPKTVPSPLPCVEPIQLKFFPLPFAQAHISSIYDIHKIEVGI